MVFSTGRGGGGAQGARDTGAAPPKMGRDFRERFSGELQRFPAAAVAKLPGLLYMVPLFISGTSPLASHDYAVTPVNM